MAGAAAVVGQSYLGALELIVSVKAPQLYVSLLCSESTPPEVVGYAAAALGNLAADYYGASSIDAADQRHLQPGCGPRQACVQ